ncbi:unnamed protein product [Symbiodinium sp. CCMP2456]|nr:unnamed protein product [Symbiodinium sp. CCMP2456]
MKPQGPDLSSSLLDAEKSFAGLVSGTWAGTGICDLRASVTAQQKQIDSLVDRVAMLLSSMHSEVLQDVQAAFGAFNFEARLTEMRRVGEELDSRLNEFRNQARRFGFNETSAIQEEVLRLGETMHGFDARLAAHEQKLHELEDHVGESMIAVHDRLTSQWDSMSLELKKLADRVDNAESDVALLSDEDPGNYAETLQKASEALRIECQEFVLQQLEPATARLATLEEYFSQQHLDLLRALQNTEGAGPKDGDTAHKEWQRQAQDDMRQHGEQLLHLTREVRDVRALASTLERVVEGHRERTEKIVTEKPVIQDLSQRMDLVQAKLEAGANPRAEQRVDEMDARLSSISLSTSQELRFLAQQLRDLEGTLSKRADSAEKTTERLQVQVQDLVSVMKDLPMALLSGPSLQSDVEDRMLQALERKVDLASQDLRCQLESQIAQMSNRDHWQLQSDARALEDVRDMRSQKLALEVRKEFEQKLADNGMATQQFMRELRQELEARASQSQRQGEELRREMELKLERKSSASEMAMEELRHTLDNMRTQQQGTLHKLSEDMKQMSAELEVRLVKAQGSSQRLAAELHKDLEVNLTETSRQVLHEERQQLVSEFRQDLERRLQRSNGQASSDQVRLAAEEIRQLRAAMDSTREIAEEARRDVVEFLSRGSDDSFLEAAERAAQVTASSLEDRFCERLDRCDAAASSCEQLTKEMENRLRQVSSELRAHQQLVSVLAPSLQSMEADSVATATAAATAAAAAATEVLSEVRNSPAMRSLRSSPSRSLNSTTQELFRRSDEAMSEQPDSRTCPISPISEEAEVDEQSFIIQGRRQKNRDLSVDVDQFSLQQKVARSLAGLED